MLSKIALMSHLNANHDTVDTVVSIVVVHSIKSDKYQANNNKTARSHTHKTQKSKSDRK